MKRFGLLPLLAVLGLAWAGDVGVITIASPPDTVVQNAPFVPGVICCNYGTTRETLLCTICIDEGIYMKTRSLSLAAGAESLVTFLKDSVEAGSHKVWACTVLPGDTAPGNDTFRKEFTCLGHDVGATAIVSPEGDVALNVPVRTRVTATNFGGFDETFKVWFRIYETDADAEVYRDTLTATVPAGAQLTVHLPHDWRPPALDSFRCVAYSTLASDQVRANDTTVSVVQVVELRHDVGVSRIVAPEGLIYVGDTVAPRGEVGNHGLEREGFVVHFGIDPVWSESLPETLDAGQSRDFAFGTWRAESAGTFAIACSTGLAGDQNYSNDVFRLPLRIWQRRVVSGSLLDSNSHRPIPAQLTIYFAGDTHAWRTTRTDSLGRFTFPGIDTAVVIRIDAGIPYPDRVVNLRIQGDTAVHLTIPAADLLLVNNDSLSRYESFYTSTFETLGLTYCLHRRRNEGPIPGEALRELGNRLVVWYTGQTLQGTLDAADTSSLGQFLDGGGRLLITGQNLGEELGTTPFYSNRLHARIESTNVYRLYLYANAADSVGQRFGRTQTAGYGGANNQNSRDLIAPDSLAGSFMFYDSTRRDPAGIYSIAGSGARHIYLACGFEAINRPANHPEFMSRVTFFSQCYSWLMGMTGITGPAICSLNATHMPTATVVRGMLWLAPASSLKPQASSCLLDACGRQVIKLHPGANDVSRLSPGIYFVRDEPQASSLKPQAVRKVILTR